LTRLLDGGVSPATRAEIQNHARSCARCRRRLREHEAVEVLMRLLPQALVPCEPSRAAQVRLWALARWFVDPMAAWRARVEIGAVGLGVTALGIAVAVSTGYWAPLAHDPTGLLVLTHTVSPDVAAMLPLGWR
jgi:anti-sigma factor RsiW